jgi:hypothetical protein
MKKNDKPYMDAPKKNNSKVKEQLIFDKGPSIDERKKKDKKYQENNLNE